ncbi:ubiquitin carboxyl-terminal hydrolase MINDY-1-like isoform X2 [Telopea speciosissima]|uniref:ubiquitin carboxyl-terminal hydrolase MINDY-1-like isoform X2 n=1 Tax=Telopea speciosissima TaxID=54955 RepID=UPI001CC5DB2A|nr:ubiquitin carboxyl-terminal hydrolase MINDY-1-like isoform X2 [Telopea speciosissima]
MATEDRRQEEEQECLYKTKVVQFLGRTTPIILQNDNGPCPLLAICNLLLLKNNLNLNVDASEVSLQKLLSLVAERLIDSNSNIENKDAGYVENQQQNIADAIDLLPRLATGIDVNIQFRRIDDFEFTRECAIFDLLDIPLYHGWIVDPQDYATANAIGFKSYNTLMGELVALETKNSEHKSNSEEDSIDFAAATAATLGVPSPSLSRGKSFDESPCAVSGHQEGKTGDLEEQAELLRVLNLSEFEVLTSVDESPSGDTSGGNRSAIVEENEYLHSNRSEFLADALERRISDEHEVLHLSKPSISQAPTVFCGGNNIVISSETTLRENDSCSKIEAGIHADQLKNYGSQERTDILVHNQSEPFHCLDQDFSSHVKDHMHSSERDPQVQQTCLLDTSMSEIHHAPENNLGVCETTASTRTSTSNPESDEFSGSSQHIDQPKSVASSLEGSEPIYEGEECILDSGLTIYENREPMYEGEMVLAEQADNGAGDGSGIHPRDEITQQKGELIKNFLRNNASQLTIYGLFCLQEGLKERELCVFFRNNHFSTMFKFNGELYLLATDQGYISQPDLVWEKLNEVNGDTVFMTGNFKEFKVENHVNDQWNEQNAVACAADYIASIDNSVTAGSTLNSDLQLAIALQQQEFEQQPQRQNTQQSTTSSSRLVTGLQVPKSSGSHSSTKQEAKSKEKCIVM